MMIMVLIIIFIANILINDNDCNSQLSLGRYVGRQVFWSESNNNNIDEDEDEDGDVGQGQEGLPHLPPCHSPLLTF